MSIVHDHKHVHDLAVAFSESKQKKTLGKQVTKRVNKRHISSTGEVLNKQVIEEIAHLQRERQAAKELGDSC